MIEQMIEKVFALRNAAHTEHWKTKSYAQHVALGEFYSDVIETLDKYVEAHQGTFGIIDKVKGEETNVISQINDELVWLHENRSAITRGVSALENIIDELSGVHMKALYKLENLK